MSAPNTIRPSIFLDYGADGVAAEDAACEICERGMRFTAQWHFALGTMLHIAFAFEDGGTQRIEAEGFVIECCPVAQNEFLTTLAFVEIPQELRESLGKVSNRLEFRRMDSGAEPSAH